MGVINAENLLKFKSTDSMFARIKKKLSSFDAQGLIDDGDFHKMVADVCSDIGVGVFRECEAVIPVKDRKARLPKNHKIFHAAYACTANFNSVKSINEQKPIIYYTDTEISKVCPNKCCIECVGDESKTKVVIRTYVNGDDYCTFRNPVLLSLSPNVKALCTEDCASRFCANGDEITIDDEGYIHTVFDEGHIYLQYYGLPFDENELPMIPDDQDYERAVEYYIYKELFQEFMWNSTVPGVERFYMDAKNDYFSLYFPQAKYKANLPSFQKTIQSIRRQRNRGKFWYFAGDRTISYRTRHC